MTNLANAEATVKNPSLLFVDDEPSILMNLRVVFRNGYHVTVTTDGFEAIELLKTKRFDVIISDQRMPNITGVEVLRQAHALAPNTIRVLLTGYSDTDAILGAINDVEVHRFLQKPWDVMKLRQTIDEAVQLAGSLYEGEAESKKRQSQPSTADVIPLHKNAAGEISTLEPEAVLILDSKRELFTEIRNEMKRNNVEVVYASNVMDVFQILESKAVSTIVCSFDVQSEADRTFIQMLKQEHPYILVIAVCDSTDSMHLIELINQAKIFRFLKKPVNTPQLCRYIKNAVALAEEMKRNPLLIRKQQADRISDVVTKSASAMVFRQHFERINKSVLLRFSRLLGFFGGT